MARIRAVHPGQWTDEAFVQCSAFARLLAIGLRNECDDVGLFEWKPLRLKMRLFPADTINVDELLAELTEQNIIRRYSVDGREYGAVRNFCRYQRPKKPNQFCPAPADVLAYVAHSGELDASDDVENDVGTEPVGNRYGTGGEKSPQKEIGRKESGTKESGTKEKESYDRAAARPDDAYAFAGHVIRLSAADLARWRIAFPSIELLAELEKRDAWLRGQPEPDRKKWFQSTAAWLSKVQTEAAAKAPKRKSSNFKLGEYRPGYDLPPTNEDAA
jgi:hypothetical protein